MAGEPWHDGAVQSSAFTSGYTTEKREWGERKESSADGLTSSGARPGWGFGQRWRSLGQNSGVDSPWGSGACEAWRAHVNGELGATVVLCEADCGRGKWGKGKGAGVCEAQKELGPRWLHEGGATWVGSLGVCVRQAEGWFYERGNGAGEADKRGRTSLKSWTPIDEWGPQGGSGTRW